MEILLKLVRQIFGWDNKAENIVLGINYSGPRAPLPPPYIHVPVPHPDNVPGPFYTEVCCLVCGAPEAAAPELIGWANYSKEGMNCIFIKQPETPEEVEKAINAMSVSCVANLRYRGEDSFILEKLKAIGNADVCDALDPL
jgi:hypothetical protein